MILKHFLVISSLVAFVNGASIVKRQTRLQAGFQSNPLVNPQLTASQLTALLTGEDPPEQPERPPNAAPLTAGTGPAAAQLAAQQPPLNTAAMEDFGEPSEFGDGGVTTASPFAVPGLVPQGGGQQPDFAMLMRWFNSLQLQRTSGPNPVFPVPAQQSNPQPPAAPLPARQSNPQPPAAPLPAQQSNPQPPADPAAPAAQQSVVPPAVNPAPATPSAASPVPVNPSPANLLQAAPPNAPSADPQISTAETSVLIVPNPQVGRAP